MAYVLSISHLVGSTVRTVGYHEQSKVWLFKTKTKAKKNSKTFSKAEMSEVILIDIQY